MRISLAVAVSFFSEDVFVVLVPDVAAEIPAVENKIGTKMVAGGAVMEMLEGMVVIVGLEPHCHLMSLEEIGSSYLSLVNICTAYYTT